MNAPDPNKFGKGRFAEETEHYCQQLQQLLHMPEPLALLIAKQAANDAARFSKLFTGRPTIRDVATLIGSPTTGALRVVNACAWLEAGSEYFDAAASTIRFEEPLAKWIETVAAAIAINDGGATAKRKVAAEAKMCPCCRQWEYGGHVTHTPTCQVKIREAIDSHQSSQLSQKQLEHQKINAAIKSAKLAAKLGAPVSAPSPKQSKPHHNSSWPPIISGGGVETNRRKH